MPDSDKPEVKAPPSYRGLGHDPVLTTLVETLGSEFRTPVVMIVLLEQGEPYIAGKTGIVGFDAERAAYLILPVIEASSASSVRDIRGQRPPPPHGVPRGVRFHASAPLINEDGQAIGALLIADSKPRRIGQSALAQLDRFATLAYAALTRSYYAAKLETRVHEIEKLKQRNESILTASVDAIASFEPIRNFRGDIEDYKLVQYNPAFERILDRPKEDLHDARLLEAFPQAEDLGVFERFRQVAETGKPTDFEEAFTQNGLDTWYRITAVATGQKGFTLTLSSIQERKMHQQSLERANAKLRQFSVAVAHDLKAPLRHLQGFGRIVKSRMQVTALHEDLVYLDELDRAADRLKAMLDGLLDYTMLGNQEHTHAHCSLQDCAELAAEPLGYDSVGATLNIDLDHLPDVVGDKVQIQRVFHNLFDNALKYHSAEPLEVSVTGEVVKGLAIVTVRDNGIGIAPEYHEKVFDLFTRLPEAQDQAHGSGIGLPICRQIAESFGGSLELRKPKGQEAQGEQGSTFQLTLPIAEPHSLRKSNHAAA
ncbi:sensor histidine kinase [Woodsholea maritima]|uniref:sensor histidine kinase n=1 Tax=Woodsholea maritima TaxID=240237 RepID=UPI00037031F4|nr:PAS domain-containing sensor histidine kinase [Woodsholea maritima]